MTYKERYEQCGTLNDLADKLIDDIEVVLAAGDYEQLNYLKKAAKEVLIENGWSNGKTLIVNKD